MEFLAPLMLIGALGAALPIAIHLIGRRRAKRVRFAAIDFLLGTDRRVKRRLQLREVSLLAARILACLAIPLALAKPFTSCSAEGPEVTRGPQAAVIVIDNSFGQSYQRDDESLLARSRQRARRILDQLGPEAEVAILATAEGSDPPTELSRDHLRLRDRIRGIELAARPANLTEALRRAATLTSGSSHPGRTVFFLGVPAKAAIRGDEAPWTAEDAPTLRVFDPAKGEELDNLAVTDLAIEPDSASGSRGLKVTAEVKNFGHETVTDRPIALRIDGRVVARGLVTVAAGLAQSKQFSAVLPSGGRAAKVSVELDGDALAIDDTRYALAELREEIPILMVNGDPRSVRYDDELFYLAAALRPGDRADSGAVLTTIPPGELERATLEDYAVIVLANVPALSPSQVTRLRTWVEGGGGLWISVGDNVVVDAYNRNMAALLPQPLSSVVDLTYGASGGEKTSRSLRLAKLDVDHPIFQVFPPDAPGLRQATFSKMVLLGPTPQVAARRVLARFDNGTAALVDQKIGDGRVLLFTSTLDRDWSDLAIHPGFVPLVQQTARYLAHIALKGSERAVLVGQPTYLDIAGDTQRVEITHPHDHRSVIEGEQLSERRRVRFDGTTAPGFYDAVVWSGESGESTRDATFVVNLDPRGSDLRRVSEADLVGSENPAVRPAAEPTTHRRRLELWHAAAAALLLFLLAESILVWRR